MRKAQPSDAMGQMLTDQAAGRPVSEFIEREDGYLDTGSNPGAYVTQNRSWPRHLRAALKSARGRVLDVGCGAGRHSIFLQDQGLEVLGVDVSPGAVRVAKARGLKSAACLSITQIDRRLGVFDTILMLGANFGLFANPQRARWLLRRWRCLTSPDARIIAESNDIYQTQDKAHLAYQRSNRRRGRMSGQIRFRVRYLEYIDPWIDYLMVSPNEMSKIVTGTGWRIDRFFYSTGPPYIAVMVKEVGTGE